MKHDKMSKFGNEKQTFGFPRKSYFFSSFEFLLVVLIILSFNKDTTDDHQQLYLEMSQEFIGWVEARFS